MKLFDIPIGVPLLRFKTRISHATPRKPTVFERIILDMADRLGQNASFNNIPVERLFIDVFCVPDPGPLVTPTLSGLIALDLIRCIVEIERLDTLTLRDIEVTERGKKIIAEDMLPSKLMQNEEVFYYDPILLKLLSESESRAYRPVEPEHSIDCSVFEGVFPEELIRSNIGISDFRWFNSSSQIERVESLSVDILWKETPFRIEIQSGVLKVASNNAILNDYLVSIESDETYTRFIQPNFDNHILPVEDLPVFNDDDLRQTSTSIQSISQVFGDWPIGARFVIPGSDFDPESIPAKAPDGQAIVLYDETHPTKISIEWNSNKSGCKIFVNTPHPLPHRILVTDRDNLIYKSITAKYGNEQRKLILACHIPNQQDDKDLNNAISNISDLIKSSYSQSEQDVLIFWLGESQFLKDHTNHLANSSLSIDEIVQKYFSILSDAERLIGKVNRDEWLKELCRILVGKIAFEGGDFKYTKQLLSTLTAYSPYPIEITSELIGVVIAGSKPPQISDDLLQLIDALRILDSNWSPEYPSEFFTREFTQSIIAKFPDLDPKLFSIENLLFDHLKALLELYKNLHKMLGNNGMNLLVKDDDYISIIKSQNGPILSDIAYEWAGEMNSLMSILDDTSVLEGTQLLATNMKITEISKWSEKLLGSLNPRVRSVYVFDTSALIKHPQIVLEPSEDELFVVAKRVIEELDEKKLDDALRPNVSEAIRNLKKLRKEQIHFCDGDMALLSTDYSVKGDNLILSVAVRYKKYKPIIVTNDNNLSLKARAERLEAMSSEEFSKKLDYGRRK